MPQRHESCDGHILKVVNLASSSSGSGTVSFVAVEDVGSAVCTFTGTMVPFKYTIGSNVIKFSAATGVTGSPAGTCGGTATFSGQFALEATLTSKAVTLD